MSSQTNSNTNCATNVCHKKQWDMMYERLIEYKKTHGDCLVPDKFVHDRKLSFWVQDQRKRGRDNNNGKKISIMTNEQKDKLNEIGFVWKVKDTWDGMYQRLVEYKHKHNNCMVPRNYAEDPKLARWVNKQRSMYWSCHNGSATKAKPYPVERKRKLEEIGFVFRLKTMCKWDDMYGRLVQYKERHGDCLVPQDYTDDPSLGRFVNNQRTLHNKGTLSDQCVKKLKAIDFYFGASRNDAWNEMYGRLVQYKEKYGHCLLQPPHIDQLCNNDDRLKELSIWVNLQRKNYKNTPKHNSSSSTAVNRKRKLDELGFVWNTSVPSNNSITIATTTGGTAASTSTTSTAKDTKVQKTSHSLDECNTMNLNDSIRLTRTVSSDSTIGRDSMNGQSFNTKHNRFAAGEHYGHRGPANLLQVSYERPHQASPKPELAATIFQEDHKVEDRRDDDCGESNFEYSVAKDDHEAAKQILRLHRSTF